MKLRLPIVFISVAFLLFFSACDRSSGKDGHVSYKNIVKINGKTYTTRDLWDFSNIILWEIEPKDLHNQELQDKLLNDFIEHKLLLQEAERRGIAADKDKLNQLFLQLGSSEGSKELKAITGHYYIDSDKVAKIAEERLIVDELFRELVDTTSYVSEAELKKYYDSKNFSRVPTGEAHILHIFTTDNATAQLAAKELASGILFPEVARKYSEGPEKNNGGDLGFVKESDYPEFFSTAFRLKEGEVSGIVKSDYGYHIFKMVQYAKASRNSYDNVKTKLLAELYTQKRQEIIREYVNALHSNADIQYLSNFTLDELFPAEERR